MRGSNDEYQPLNKTPKPMNKLKSESPVRATLAFSPRTRLLVCSASVALVLGLTHPARGQVDYSTDFNGVNANESGWSHYNPGTAGGQTPTWTFVSDGSATGSALKMFAPPLNCAGAFNRGGSYRSEQYTEFFEGVDLLNYIVGQYGSAMLLGARL